MSGGYEDSRTATHTGAERSVRFFREKISKNHTLGTSLRRGDSRVTEESTIEFEVVCDLSPLLCVCVSAVILLSS